MIALRDASVRYDGGKEPVVTSVSVEYSAGEFALVAGATGSGKSTMLRMLNGLAPHFTGGELSGQIVIDGRDRTGQEPHDFAHLVGYVNQLAEASFVADTVREELAFGMEQLGTSQEVMASRIAKVAEALDLTDVLDAPLDELSGGFQQRVAIAAALAAGQQILLLDEPTSELDEVGSSSLLGLLQNLAHRSGITVILAEHRVDRLLSLVDSLTVVRADGRVIKHSDRENFWAAAESEGLLPKSSPQQHRNSPSPKSQSQLALEAIGVSVSYGLVPALENANLRMRQGEITGIYGPNGSGKSSLLWALQGSVAHEGIVRTATDAERRPSWTNRKDRSRKDFALVPQSASDLLIMHSVGEELQAADKSSGLPSGATAELFEKLAGSVEQQMHPRDLSSGQQLALALSLQLSRKTDILLLDEPTRGLDYRAREALAQQLEVLAKLGQTILVASHDREFLLRVSETCLKLAGGRVLAAGPTEVVLA